jgi:hypothetical protein
MTPRPNTNPVIRGGSGTLPFLLLLLHLAAPPPSPAAPVEAILYPHSALVTENVTVRLQPGDGGMRSAVFTLPGSAMPETMTLGCLPPGSCRIEDFRVRRIETALGPKEAEIEKRAAGLREEAARIRAAIQAVEAQVQFWQLQTKAKTKNLADATNLAAAIGRNIRRAGQEKISLEANLRKAQQRLAENEEEKAALPDRRTVSWQITVFLSGAPVRDQALTYAYRSGSCGWSPVYRIDAAPGNGKVVLSLDAEIRQATGRDWKDVHVILSAPGPVEDRPPSAGSAAAPAVPPAPPPETGKKARKAPAKKKAGASAPSAETPAAPSPQAPLPPAATVFGPWSLGKVHLPTGAAVKRNVLRETRDAAFLYRLEPGGETPLLQADALPAGSGGLPAGPAQFLVDGAVAGRGRFPLDAATPVVFGADPRVFLRARARTGRFEVVNGRPEPIRLLWQDGPSAPEDVTVSPGAALAAPPVPHTPDSNKAAPAREGATP